MHVNFLRRLYWFVRSLLFFLVGPVIRKNPRPEINQAQSILLIAFFRIGDAVYTTPVIRELKKCLPNVSIDLVCRNYTTAVFKNNPHIRNTFILPAGISEFWRVRGVLKKNSYDMVIDLTADDKVIGALFARLSGARYSLGYNIQKRGFCLDRGVDLPTVELHATKIFLHLLKELEISECSNLPELFVADNEKMAINELLKSYEIDNQDFVVGLHPGANFPSQRLHEKKWAAFCDIIQEKYQKRVALFGGPRDLPMIEAIQNHAAHAVKVIDRLTSLRQAIALIDRCNVLLCNNSGPLHIAEALGTPTISWMGPTVPYRWHPIGAVHVVIRKEVDCMPCNKGICESHQCEKLITAEDLEMAFNDVMNKITEKGDP